VISALILSAALMAPQDDLLPDGPQPYQPTAAASAPALPPQATMRPDSAEAATAADTAPLSGGAVDVASYRRNYEAPKDSRELSYDSGIFSAYASKENQMGMEGSWAIYGADNQQILALELRSENVVSNRLEGAWRSLLAGYGMNKSGFVSDVNLAGRDLEVNYFVGGARSPTILHVHKDNDNVWRGYMMDTNGDKTSVVMTQVRSRN